MDNYYIMWWAIIIIILIVIAFKIPAFGKTLLSLIALLVFVIIIYYFYNQYEESLSGKRISQKEIELVELRLVPYYSADSFKLLGLIKNKSQGYTLTSLRIRILMQDCVKDGICEVIGDSNVWMYNNIPPQQTRNIEESVYFSNMPRVRGISNWTYSITEIKGK